MPGSFLIKVPSVNHPYIIVQLMPSAVPMAAITAEARFHMNLISLFLFS